MSVIAIVENESKARKNEPNFLCLQTDEVCFGVVLALVSEWNGPNVKHVETDPLSLAWHAWPSSHMNALAININVGLE
jgi:hypothetical protein